jgi:3-demethoxyubiquinol 3-hydroxylase
MFLNQKKLDSIVRVDHAGEYGARRIYAGQMAILKKSSAYPVIKEMYEQEEKHLKYFEQEIRQRRVRPTFMLPLWHVGGYLLGAATALLGERAAMACTVAVEEVIGEHYRSQY